MVGACLQLHSKERAGVAARFYPAVKAGQGERLETGRFLEGTSSAAVRADPEKAAWTRAYLLKAGWPYLALADSQGLRSEGKWDQVCCPTLLDPMTP